MTAISSSLFLVILISTLTCYANAADRPLSCVPGRAFTYDHNICFCNDQGTKITCKRKMYSTLTPELHRLQLQNITTNCSPGELFNRTSQECVCHMSGKSASCVNDRSWSNNKMKDTRDECTPGSVFHDDCNGCICGSNGTAACTNLRCGFEETNRIMDNTTRCVPNSFLMMGCKNCECDERGVEIFCENVDCPPWSFTHENILNVTMECERKRVFDYNCHQCICDKNGDSALCSGKECPHIYDMVEVKDTVEKCNPGMIFADKCNVCICDENRKGVCTTFSCKTSYDFIYVDDFNFGIPETSE